MTDLYGAAPVAANALAEERARLMAGEVPMSSVELGHIMLALQDVLHGQRATAEAEAAYMQRMAHLEEKQARTDAILEKLAKNLENLADRYSPEEREQAKARAGNWLAEATRVAKAEAATDAMSLRARLAAERKVPVEWPFENVEPHIEYLNGIPFRVVTGHNMLPESVAKQVEARKRLMFAERAKANVLMTGDTPQGRRPIKEYGQIRQMLAEIDRRAGVAQADEQSLERLASAL